MTAPAPSPAPAAAPLASRPPGDLAVEPDTDLDHDLDLDLTDGGRAVVDLSAGEAQQLADQLAAAHGRAAAPFGTYLLSPDEPAAGLARQVEREVFGEVFGNSPALLAAQYEPYGATTRFVCVLDHRRRRAVGAVRLILPGPGRAPGVPHSTGAKSLDDLAAVWGVGPERATTASGRPIDPRRTWDIATLAVAPEYRQGLISLALYQACCTTATTLGAAGFVTILDVAVLRLLQARLGRPFAPVAGARPQRYLDSPASVPCTCDLDEWSQRVAERDPTLYETLFLGHGLEAAVSPPDWGAPPEAWCAVAGPQAMPWAARRSERLTALSTSGTR